MNDARVESITTNIRGSLLNFTLNETTVWRKSRSIWHVLQSFAKEEMQFLTKDIAWLSLVFVLDCYTHLQ